MAQIFGLGFAGFVAWVLWLVVHISWLIGFRNRLLVLFERAWAYFTYQRGARVILTPLFERGELQTAGLRCAWGEAGLPGPEGELRVKDGCGRAAAFCPRESPHLGLCLAHRDEAEREGYPTIPLPGLTPRAHVGSQGSPTRRGVRMPAAIRDVPIAHLQVTPSADQENPEPF